ncbi:MAG: hypothetical protein AAGJ79_14020, partial [Verrucomicrobiota bacterium]
MDGEAATVTEEIALIESALAGDEAAAAALRTPDRTARLESILERRGASRTESRDLVADLWADCFNTGQERGSLLDRFSGKGSIDAFLTRTALNRLIDFKRRQRFRGDLPGVAAVVDLLVDLQGPTEKRFGALVVALATMHQGQAVGQAGDFRVIFTMQAPANLEPLQKGRSG